MGRQRHRAPRRELLRIRACWDCECPVPAGEVFCVSCERHRADGHAPAWVFTNDAEYCHGAGYNGLNHSLLNVTPHPIWKVRRGARKNPHVYRESVGATTNWGSDDGAV